MKWTFKDVISITHFIIMGQEKIAILKSKWPAT